MRVCVRLYVLSFMAGHMALIKKGREALRQFDRKIIKKIYCPAKENSVWRIRFYLKIDIILNQEDMISFIKAQRI